jgi:hypothetical protein
MKSLIAPTMVAELSVVGSSRTAISGAIREIKLLCQHLEGYKCHKISRPKNRVGYEHILVLCSHTLQPFKYASRQFILDTQIFVADYIHSLVNKLQHIYCNLIYQHYNLYLPLDQSFNAKII